MIPLPGGRGGSRGLAIASCLALAAAACTSGGTSGGGGSNGHRRQVVAIGTTDTITSLDPAGAIGVGSWTPMYSMYQTLLRFPTGSTVPVPDAAKKCDFSDATHYECMLKPGLKFWNGDPLDARAVVYSFERNVAIANYGSIFLSSMKSVHAAGNDRVVFTLKSPFTVFPFVLATPSMGIVDPKIFPAHKLLANAKVVGSGPYEMTKFNPGQQLVLRPNPHYGGDLKLANDGVVVQYYSKATTLKLAIEQGDVDVAYRTLDPTDIASLRRERNRGVQVVEGRGAEIQYLVFNLKAMPGRGPAQKTAIRRAVAMTIDRAAIAKDVYHNTVKPLWSMVPDGLQGHVDAFKARYGARPNVQQARQTLQQAGVRLPVQLTLWWTPSHYGTASADMYADLQRQLQGSGLFKVTLQSAEWNQYTTSYQQDAYPAFQFGWFPDYPDPDDYVASFYGTSTSFLKDHYSNPQIDAALAKERASTDQATRNAQFQLIQRIGARDAPTIPIWQGEQFAVKRTGVIGVQQTLDPSYTFRFWMIGKS